jgi:hypothetical protein
MVLEGEGALSRTAIAAMFPAGQGPDAAELDELLAEIRRRAEAASEIYPFRTKGELIVLDSEVDPTVYFFLLILSLESSPYRIEARFGEISPLLELLTREAMLAYLGEGAEAIRFGSQADGRPTDLASAVSWLAERMELETVKEAIETDIDRDDKDGGIDVAAWRSFADGAPSFASFLIQCTTQVTYERKPADVTPEKWSSWIRFGRDPSIVLSIPFAIPHDAKIRQRLRYSVNILLDRLRLCELLSGRDMNSLEDDLAQMRSWTSDEIEKILAALANPQKPPRLAKPRRPKKDR